MHVFFFVFFWFRFIIFGWLFFPRCSSNPQTIELSNGATAKLKMYYRQFVFIIACCELLFAIMYIYNNLFLCSLLYIYEYVLLFFIFSIVRSLTFADLLSKRMYDRLCAFSSE